jgi:hypothetical protein
MAANGGPAQRISFGEGSYSTPVWSPRGDTIAFTKQAQGNFAIGIMRYDGQGERRHSHFQLILFETVRHRDHRRVFLRTANNPEVGIWRSPMPSGMSMILRSIVNMSGPMIKDDLNERPGFNCLKPVRGEHAKQLDVLIHNKGHHSV